MGGEQLAGGLGRISERSQEVRISTQARLQLATTKGWLGEVEALELNLVHIAEKLAQVERAEARQPQVTGELLTVPAPAVAE